MLSAALGIPEHGGRVRGQPGFVKQRDYFESTRHSSSSMQEEMNDMKTELQSLRTLVDTLINKRVGAKEQDEAEFNQNPTYKPKSGKASCSVQQKTPMEDPNPTGIGEVHFKFYKSHHFTTCKL